MDVVYAAFVDKELFLLHARVRTSRLRIVQFPFRILNGVPCRIVSGQDTTRRLLVEADVPEFYLEEVHSHQGAGLRRRFHRSMSTQRASSDRSGSSFM